MATGKFDTEKINVLEGYDNSKWMVKIYTNISWAC